MVLSIVMVIGSCSSSTVLFLNRKVVLYSCIVLRELARGASARSARPPPPPPPWGQTSHSQGCYRSQDPAAVPKTVAALPKITAQPAPRTARRWWGAVQLWHSCTSKELDRLTLPNYSTSVQFQILFDPFQQPLQRVPQPPLESLSFP